MKGYLLESRPLLLYTGTHGHYSHTPEFSLQASQSLLQHTGIIFSVTILFIMSGKSPFDKLNKTNYNDWKIQMEALPEEKGLFRVTCGHDIMLATGPNLKGVRTFIEKQHLAHAKIILCIEPSQIPHIRNKSDPAVIWKNLSQIHHAHGLGVLLTMCMDFLKMSMPPKSTIATYVASIHHAAYHLEECYHAEEADSFSTSPSTQSPVVSELDKISPFEWSSPYLSIRYCQYYWHFTCIAYF